MSGAGGTVDGEHAVTGVRELDLDGLPGPTHGYAGLSPGNLASTGSAGLTSNPRAAALQGLAKMERLREIGVLQAVLPPHPRPDLGWLRKLGFTGADAQVVEHTAREAPHLLAAAYSASSMWAANAATLLPASDTADGRVHMIPANLSSEVHRALEAPRTARLLRTVLAGADHFAHHAPLPIAGDEGAANHTRLCASHGEQGLHLFVYGRPREGRPRECAEEHAHDSRHPERQTEEASRAVARLGRLARERTCYVQQSPAAIDAGVFHNDVIATGDRSLLLVHEDAWVDQARVLDDLRDRFARHCGGELRVVEVERAALPLERAVATYLFNCQIVERPDGGTAFVGPVECREDPAARALVESLAGQDGPFDEVHYVDLRESMRNGGGPACLRLRAVLGEAARAAVHPGVLLDDALHARLERVIRTHYRDRLEPGDLADPALVDEARAAHAAVLEALCLAGDDPFGES